MMNPMVNDTTICARRTVPMECVPFFPSFYALVFYLFFCFFFRFRLVRRFAMIASSLIVFVEQVLTKWSTAKCVDKTDAENRRMQSSTTNKCKIETEKHFTINIWYSIYPDSFCWCIFLFSMFSVGFELQMVIECNFIYLFFHAFHDSLSIVANRSRATDICISDLIQITRA